MLFNSIDFAIFLPIVFILYWFVTNKNLKLQNLLIFIVSYIFYGWWSWKFLSLILFSTLADYSVGIGLSKETNETRRKLLLWVSILVNLGFLGFFKYYNFFVENFVSAFSILGHKLSLSSLQIVLPVGISFYTFQTLSYSIDVYNRKLEPTKDFIAFGAFVSFFPQLVAGPIERATNLLPQFYKARTFNYEKAVDGMRQILWGLFKKVVIADNCATYVNMVFENTTEYSGSTLLLGAVLFAFQIYGDFSGYSDIAIGTSRLFGFNLMRNFAFPYFSRDMAEFWRRWHISLSTWFRDYLYIPLGGSRVGRGAQIRNTFIIFIVSGFWHGANWTFIVWGALNALYFLPLLLTDRNRLHINTVAEGNIFPKIKELLLIALTFLLTVFAWIFFRAENLTHALNYIYNMLNKDLITIPEIRPFNVFIYIIVLVSIEWLNRRYAHGLVLNSDKIHFIIRYIVYVSLFVTILLNMNFHNKNEFIYFQF
jgi:alginate O-acetyltransferase complex protein AlgI